jgi:hypothetical protein
LLLPMRPVKARPNSYTERRAKAARRSSRFIAQGLRSEIHQRNAARLRLAGSRRPGCCLPNAARPPCPAKTAGHGVAPRQAERCGGCRPCDPAALLKSKPSGIAGGLFADFFGAIPVASALGIRLGATPRGQINSNTHSQALGSKDDISTLQRRRHFYFALTYSFGSLTSSRSWPTLSQ